MKVLSVFDPAFRPYGRVVEGIDTRLLVGALMDTPCPEGVVYEPSAPALEALDVFKALTNVAYGGMPIQLGYCNGTNHALNALEYHRDSEFDIAATELILLLGRQQDIEDGYTYDTAKVEAFRMSAGTAVELYATTLHYAPVGDGFRCAIVLPRGTNHPLPFATTGRGEDALLTHVNKWLIAHPEAGIAGAHVGLRGENLTA